MAMNSDALGLALARVVMNASVIPPTPEMIIHIQRFWKDIAAEIVGHIQDNAEVPAGIAVSTTGTETAQSGSTTGTGKVR
jgi:hypothetical protein